MELYQLRFFKAVAESKTLTEASQLVNVTQPSLSRAIKKLENEFGVELFNRVGRNLVLNENGKVFLDSANRTIDSAEAIKSSMQRYLNERALTLNIFAPFPLGMEDQILGNFRKNNPDIMIRFARSYVSLLGSDVSDVRFHASFKNYPEGKKVGEERIVALLPKNHPLATHHKVSLSQLARESIVTVLPCPLRLVLDAAFTKLGVEPRIVLEDQHCQHMAEYVAEGLGISIGADITWIAAGQDENVALVPIEEFNQARNLYLLKGDASYWSPASVRFADYLTEHYRERRQYLDSSYSRR